MPDKASDMTQLGSPPRLDIQRDALFVDIDGTIAEIVELPRNVAPQSKRNALLLNLGRTLNGRIAVLTGRTLVETDRILEGAVATVAAVHGLVRRDAKGQIEAVPPGAGLRHVREELTTLMHEFPNLILEEKGSSIAVHFRQSPQAAQAVHQATSRIASLHGLAVQDGAMVSELRTPGPDKGDSLGVLMKEPPFAGAIPVMVGDDITDERAFEAAHALGGYGILVGPQRATHAQYSLRSVDDVLVWLRAGLT